ncbi:MAG: alpha/beta hydrolase [Actinomycetota bacterium]|nr:alpha/beta hydrolase [Actinomycetota bacterium]
MALDESAKNLLDMLKGAGGAPLESVSPAEARERYGMLALLNGEQGAVATVLQREIGGVPAFIATPNGDGPFPVFVWMHGGGWTVGTAAEALATITRIAQHAGCIAISLDYRLAPEHKAPAALDDCVAAVSWLLDNAGELGGNPAKVAVGGESAGGNLAAVLAQHFGPRLCAQVLVCPGTDFTVEHQSRLENATGYLLTKATMDWFAHQYLDGSGVPLDDPRVSPLVAPDAALANAAPALVITTGFDPLRDEGEAYAARLAAAGVHVVQRRFAGQVHLFFSLCGAIPEGTDAEGLVVEVLSEAFGR